MTALRWFAFALIAAFELAVLVVLMPRPNVDASYRAFFIDRSTDCWRLRATGSYTLGQTVNFAQQGDTLLQHRICGFIDPEPNGTWSLGQEAELRFAVSEDAGDIEVALEMLPFVSQSHPTQRVRLLLDTTELASLTLTATSPTSFRFPVSAAEVAARQGTFILRFELPDATSSRDLGINNDTRRLAIRLQSVRIGPPGEEEGRRPRDEAGGQSAT